MNTTPTPRYTARLSGSSWRTGPEIPVATITEGRRWAESHGTTADHCEILDRRGRIVAVHKRSTEGNGMDWYKAAV